MVEIKNEAEVKGGPLPPPAPTNQDVGMPEDVDITEDDKREWMRHLLGGDRFYKTYELYGGRITVTLRNRTQEENDAIMELLSRQLGEEDRNVPLATFQARYLMRMHIYMLAASLAHLQYKSEESGENKEYPPLYESTELRGAEAVAHVYRERVAPLPEGLLATLLSCQRQFEALCTALVASASRPDFW